MHVRQAGQAETGELVARAKQGDRAAFDVLVERYTPRIYNVALRITGSPDEAADCVQDAFIRAFSSLHRFRGEAAFSTWLYRVAVNVANDASRRLRSQPLRASELGKADSEDSAPDLDRGGIALEGDAEGPEDSLLRAQRQEVIFAAIRSLPEHYRAVVVLYDIQGLSYEEIAAVVGVRVGTVKSRLNRARLALKERLEPHLELLRD